MKWLYDIKLTYKTIIAIWLTPVKNNQLLLKSYKIIIAIACIFLLFSYGMNVTHYELKVLYNVVKGRFADYLPFLSRSFIWVAVLLVLYRLFLYEKYGSLFNKIISIIYLYRRPLLVASFGIAEGVIFYFLYFNWHEIISHFSADGKKDIPVWPWSFFTMLVAAPIAFLIWSFRNNDKRKDLQHIEENIRQTDFHKIEGWATTFPTITAPEVELVTTENLVVIKETTNETGTQTNANKDNPVKLKIDETKAGALQIAAIYQLLPYLKGEYGERFVRPTMEIYRSLLSSWKWSEKKHTLAKVGESNQIKKPPYIAALHTLFLQEAKFFASFHTMPVCKKNNWKPLHRIDLKRADLKGAYLKGADLKGTDLKGADLKGADLKGADLKGADLKGADLKGADLKGADLKGADVKGADIKEADLRGADLKGVHIKEFINYKEADIGFADF
jgi:Pentapeptide repeats (8 copies)